MLRIGMLMPRSTLYPALGLDILNGLKENLKRLDIFEKVKLIVDNIGFGIDEPEIYSKAEKMILQEDADLVIVCADTIVTEMLQPLFTASNKLLLVVNFGANTPESWHPAPTSMVHSLNFCLQTKLTGKLAARETNGQAANVSSYFDGGYRQCYFMLNSHQQNGGIARFNYVTKHKVAEFTLEPLQEFMEQNPDVKTLLCLFSGEMAEQFYREIAPLQQQLNLSIYVSPMLLDGDLEVGLGTGFSIQQVKGYVPWHAALPNATNQVFKKTIHASADRQANYFMLLGWDAASIVGEIIKLHESGKTRATEVVTALTQINFESPRGWMKLDAATHYSYGPAYLAEWTNDGQVGAVTEMENIESAWNDFTGEQLPEGISSSWRNTYLCI